MRTFLTLLLLTGPAFAQQHIATTPPLTPEQEQKTFTVPKGFRVELVAAEADILKPIQHCFDARGRLWVSCTTDYPFPAAEGQGKDSIRVLEDFDANGRAKKITKFVDGLTIPIGVLPLPDCKSCIAYSVPFIRKFTDTDGDGKADTSEILYGPFGVKDTHGMVNSFTLMPDGWVYACHGFSNDSEVKGKDGHTIKMSSGSTFRFKINGSRIEIFTRGQVNPFGMTVDPDYNFYTADCHSKPITQLIRGATYTSFGKPHDGLGFGPEMIGHEHGSTALCGLAWYDDTAFPKEYLNTMFQGNVVTNRINCDRIEFTGSTPKAIKEPDFLTSTDPWFRPADIKLGPDGCLYVTDFYNRIIGHYEVALDHAGRDKTRGRIWRIRYENTPLRIVPDLLRLSTEELKKELSSPNLPMRLAALEQVQSRSPRVDDDVLRLLKLGAADRTLTAKVRNPLTLRVHMDLLTERPDPKVVGAIVDVIARTPTTDTHLIYSARVALRETLRNDAAWETPFLGRAAEIVADVCLGLPTKRSAAFVRQQLVDGKVSADRRAAFVEFVAFRGEQEAADLTTILTLGDLAAIRTGYQKRGTAVPLMLREKAVTLIRDGLSEKNLATILLAVESAGAWKVTALADSLADLVSAPAPLGESALSSLAAIAPERAMPLLVTRLTDGSANIAVRESAAKALANIPASVQARLTALPTVPASVQSILALGLAGKATTAQALLEAVKSGKASARLLQEKPVMVALKGCGIADVQQQVNALTKNLPTIDQAKRALIAQRAADYRKITPDAVAGKLAFTKSCAACHQIAGAGGKVGPQLDGIGIRGLDRLLEDVLDPDRNVDHAFRATKLTIKDGRTKMGIVTREEGETVILADDKGKEERIAKADIEDRLTLPLSPMPANFHETVSPADFMNLLAYLLDQRPPVKP